MSKSISFALFLAVVCLCLKVSVYGFIPSSSKSANTQISGKNTIVQMSSAAADLTLAVELKSCALEGNSKRAMEILDSMDGDQKSSLHYNRALKACARGNQLDLIDKIHAEMKENGVIMDDGTYSNLIQSYIAGGNDEKAASMFEEGREEGLDNMNRGMYNRVLGAYRRLGKMDMALELCEEMRFLRMEPTVEAYAFIATKAVKDDKSYLIPRTIETMQSEGFSSEDIDYVKQIIKETSN